MTFPRYSKAYHSASVFKIFTAIKVFWLFGIAAAKGFYHEMLWPW
jgi:hypothetical protein